MPSHPERPSGAPRPQPSAAVYRRRRIVAGVAAAAVLLLVAVGLGVLLGRLGGGSGGADPTPTTAGTQSPSEQAPTQSPAESPAPSPSASPTPAPSTTAAPTPTPPDPAIANAPACAASDLRLSAGSASTQPRGGDPVELSLGIVNLSSEPCRLDVGTAQQEFTVRDGGDQVVFSTRVCQEEPTHQDMLLPPHEELTALYRWDVRRSPGQCGQPGADLEPGMHLLTVSLGELTSRPVSLRILAPDPAKAAPTPSPSVSAATSAPAVTSPAATPAPSATSAAPTPAPAPSGTPAPSTPAPSTPAPSSSPSP